MMLTAAKLEMFLEIEQKLRAEYEPQLATKSADLERCQQELATQRQQLQATIDKQLATIAELSGKATANQRTEQLNRELHNRSENLQEDVATLKQRAKALQKDLGEAREQIKVLMQFDAPRMKKNLDANKKKLAEEAATNELLQKELNKIKIENATLQRKVREAESKLAEQDVVAEDEAA